MKPRGLAVVFAVLVAFVALPAGSETSSPAFVTGGVGAESREEMAAVRDDFSLHIWVATSDGSFLSDVTVRIHGKQGELVFEATTEGPLLYVDVKAGSYRVTATRADGPQETQSVKIPESGSPVRVVFRIGPT